MTDLARIRDDYFSAVYDTDLDKAMAIMNSALEQGVDPRKLVFEVVVPSSERMIKAMSEDFNANLAQHFMTSQIAAKATEHLLAYFPEEPSAVGTVIIGTSRGDLHTLGKRIVTGCLKSLLIRVVDLGENISAERFVEEAVAHQAGVIAVSSMMVHTARGEDGSRAIRRLLQERNLESQIKLVVGGAPFRFDPELFHVVGADAWAEDGIAAGKVISQLLQRGKHG